MRKTMTVAAALIGLLAGSQLFAQSGATTETSLLTVRGGSTLRSWSCSTDDVRASIRTDGDAGVQVAGLPAGEHRVAVAIPVASLDCRNGTMNGHMRRALGERSHPLIRFAMTGYDVAAPGRVSARGELTVNGETTPIRLDVAVAPAPSGVRATGSVELRMTELGVEPPSLMLGTLKVHDPVTIEFDVYLAHNVVAVR